MFSVAKASERAGARLVSPAKKSIKTLFTWSGGPRSSGVGFFCFHGLGDTKQKKPTPLDRGPPLHACKQVLSDSFWRELFVSLSPVSTRECVTRELTKHVKTNPNYESQTGQLFGF